MVKDAVEFGGDGGSFLTRLEETINAVEEALDDGLGAFRDTEAGAAVIGGWPDSESSIASNKTLKGL